MSNEWMLSFLSIAFALLATVLAVVGVHGVLVFQIARVVRCADGVGRWRLASSGSSREIALGECSRAWRLASPPRMPAAGIFRASCSS